MKILNQHRKSPIKTVNISDEEYEELMINIKNIVIYVPDEALEYYITETYLSHCIDKVKPLSELPNE